ncbi:MAG: TIGR00725 family protein [Candidatus Omnitrophica bacterium]|nr:TIGR00725 family protein [Candidatus Omnitrophota bacterium]MBU4477579.1 TIGR00725 family protein [Candidatus Omnitrophota bacterium]MCG2703607.1 TIGR00725 family protein [Candidatus Omnitrophota bacterium]
MDKILISVIGGHKTDKKTAVLAESMGRAIAQLGAILICGGLSGVMEHAAKGAKSAGGKTVGILPGDDKNDANPFIDIPIPTGLGFMRNTLVAGCADIVVAMPGKEGTLSEIGFALSAKKPVIGLKTWDIPGVIKAADVDDAVRHIRRILKGKPPKTK